MAEEVYKAVVGGGKSRAKLRASLLVIATLVVLAGLGVGGYALFHKPAKTTPIARPTQTIRKGTTNNGDKSTGQGTVNNAVLSTHHYTQLGYYLTDPAGNTLYTYSKDTSGTSACTGTCLETWPAYQAASTVTGLPSTITTIKRTDNGQTQYVYNGRPLYYYAGDSTSQVTGDGINDFHVAKP